MDVDADQVDQRARPDRPPRAVQHRLVQILGRHAGLVEHADAVVQERDQDAVDDEARRVGAADRLLADALRERVGGVVGGGVGELRAHDLHERQHRGGIEEVHPDDARWMRGRGGDLGDGESRRVRGQDRLLGDDSVERGEQLLLRLDLLDDRLDDEVAAGEVAQIRRDPQPAECRVHLVLRQSTLLDPAREIALDRRAALLGELVRDLAPDRFDPCLHADLGDSRTHRPEADHAHRTDLHGRRL